MRVYLDICCINRPLDDQSADRVRRETTAVEAILEAIAAGRLTWVAGPVVRLENRRCRDLPGGKRLVSCWSLRPNRSHTTTTRVASPAHG